MDDPMDYLLDYSSDPEDIEMSFQDISPSPEILIYITDLTIECSFNGSGQDVQIDTLAIQILEAADEDDVSLLQLEEITETGKSWKYNGQIEISITNDGITFVAQSGQGHVLGHTRITPNDLGRLTRQGLPTDKIIHTLEADNNATNLKLSLNISNALWIGNIMKTECQVIDLASLFNEYGNEWINQIVANANGDEDKSAIQTEIINLILHGDEDKYHHLKFHRADALHNRFYHTGDLTDIAESISLYREVINDIPEGHSDMTRCLGNLGSALSRRFDHTADQTDILEAIFLHQRAISLTPEGHPHMAGCLKNLGLAFFRCFKNTGDMSDISQSISTYQKAIDLIPEGHSDMAPYLLSLGNAFFRRFEHTKDLRDISEAISIYEKVINVTPKEHSKIACELGNLGNAFVRLFEITGDLKDISKAISIHQKAVNLTPGGDSHVAQHLDKLGNAFSSRYKHTKDITDVSEAISVYKQAVNLTPEGHLDMPRHLQNLTSALVNCFEHTGNLMDISEAISTGWKAINCTHKGHSDMPQMLGTLAHAFFCRFEHKGDFTDILEAISLHQKAIHLTPEGHSAMKERLANLASTFMRCFDYTGDLSHISQAISIHQKAIHLTPEGHPDLPIHLEKLASALSTHVKHTGDLTDISESICMYQKAINLTPRGYLGMFACLANLALAYSKRFGHTGNLTDISEAISTGHKAIALIPEGHLYMARCLGDLGDAFLNRFEHTGDPTDIWEAKSMHQRAIDLTPEGHSDMPARLGALASVYSELVHITWDNTNLLEALLLRRKAIDLTPEGHSDMPRLLASLGSLFTRLFYHTGDLAYDAEAMSTFHKAINLTPEDHVDMPVLLGNLGNAFVRCFERTENQADILEAIRMLQKSINCTSEGHSDMPVRFRRLADAFYTQFTHTNNISALEEAVTHWHQSAILPSGSPSTRLKHAIKWATFSEQLDDSEQTLKAYDFAVGLLSQVVGMEKTIKRQYSDLVDISDFPRQAAAYACSQNCPDKAIEWLEQGRCLVWSHLNSLRSPLDELHDCQPQLADEFKRVSQQLEMAASRSEHMLSKTMEQQVSQQQEAHNHLQIAKKREQLLAQIRDIPEFKNFLQPQPCSELLCHLPKSGSVVVINVHSSRCDALVLVNGLDSPLHIPLPKISLEDAEVLYECLQICMGNNRGDNSHNTDVTNERRFSRRIPGTEPGIQYILREIWDNVVKPILDGLDYSSPPDLEQLPHIWWCATGPLALLPIHAAGVYSTSLTETTHPACTLSHFAISSYIPTVTALTERVKNIYQMQNTKTRLFMISQPDTPGQLEIPGTTQEVNAVEQLLKSYNIEVSCLHRSNATLEQVMANMDTHSCVHFACHASQHPDDPLESAFFLHDGKLNLSTIIKKNLTEADLAFLSACQTSVGDKKLQDEAVHLAAGMLAAGYQGVVGTMWSIKDDYAPQVAKYFYAQLMDEAEKVGQKDFDGRNAAFSMHHAIQKLRNEIGDSEQSLLTWVPYVHFGL